MPLIPREARDGEGGADSHVRDNVLRACERAELTKLVFQSGTVYNSIGHIMLQVKRKGTKVRKCEDLSGFFVYER